MTDDDNNADRYQRTAAQSSLNDLLGGVKNVEPPLLGRSLEWWEARDREVGQIKAQREERDELHRMTERAGELRDNGFPEMCISQALGDLKDTPAMKWARQFVQLGEHGLRKRLIVLAGGVGAGKSTASAWIALKGRDPRPGFMRIGELERRGRYDKKLDEWLKDKTSLVIDDVGTEVLDGKNVFAALFGEIVDMFYSMRRTLVLTTNLRPRISDAMRAEAEKSKTEPEPQFLERYGERVWSRMNQMAMWGDCGTRDLRKEKP